MRIHFLFFYLLLLSVSGYGQQSYDTIEINNDLKLIRLSDRIYIHASLGEDPEFGRFSSNGMIVVSDGQALLFDTPMTDELTKTLVEYIREGLGAQVVGFVPNHWHRDCMGGIGYLHETGVKTYAQERTIRQAEQRGLELPQQAFRSRLVLKAGNVRVVCRYLGAAHTPDNIVVWAPAEKVLFTGCMVKELASAGLGNTADGDLAAYPATIEKLIRVYKDAAIVIPGHGAIGGIELAEHTLKMSKDAN